MSQSFSSQDVMKVAQLANIPVDPSQATTLAQGFTTTMSVVDQLNTIDVTNISPTHHVTGLENVMREDVVDQERMFTQEEALSNASRTENGYFVVDQVIEQE